VLQQVIEMECCVCVCVCVCGLLIDSCAVVTYVSEDSATAALNATASQDLRLHNR